MALFPTFKRAKSYPPDHDYWYYPVGAPTTAGVKVDEKTALKYLTVTACVSLIATDIAKLPLNLYKKRADGGKDLVTDNHLYDLLHNAPNPETTSFNFREAVQSHLLTNGNGYAYIERERISKKIKALWQLPEPSQVEVKRRESDGVIIYVYKNQNGEDVIRTRDEIFHIPGYGFNGLVGMSMINVAKEAIGLGVAAETFGSSYFGKGTNPSGLFEMDNTLGDNAENFKKDLKENYAGLGNSHSVMVLENGMKYKPLTVPLDDAQFLETRNFQKIEICGMYHVPPHKVAIHGDNSNYNNLEQENGSYVDSCLMGWITRWEANISLQLLTQEQRKQGFFFEFVMQGLLRGDSKARAEYYNGLFRVGAITPNRIRQLENDNPVEGGDSSFVEMNMLPLDQAGDFALQEAEEPENEPEPITISEAKSFFGEKRAKKVSEAKSIQNRDRITKHYLPLILDAAQAIVNRESKAIQKKVESLTRAGQSMDAFLDDFYRSFPEYINKKMGPVLRSFILATMDATNLQLGIDGENFDTEIRDYIEQYSKRHIESSKGQMDSLIPAGLDQLDTRADEWQERRPGKISDDEAVRASSFAFQTVAFGAAFSTVWRIRGKTCPYCTSLSGKRVSTGQHFVKDGDEIDPDGGTGPMRFYGIKAHPPLHQKCLPGNANVTAFGITASSENWFDGNLVIIHTAGGNKITCTPNHPILTCHGWVNADKINIGNQVRKAILPNRDSSIVSYNQNMQTMIKNVSKSFLDHRKMIAIPVPTTSKNLKSDWADSEITIIRTDGSLLLESDPGLFHELRKFNLSLRDADESSFISNSSFAEFIKARFPSQRRGMSSRDLLLSLGGGHTLPIKQPGFTLPTKFDPVNSKVFINNHPGNSDAVRNGIDGFPIEVLADEVVRIENNAFHGLVYNLHTKDNLFYAENIVVHNCDCYLSIV